MDKCKHEWRLIRQGVGYSFIGGSLLVPSEFYCVKCCAIRRKGKEKDITSDESKMIDEIIT